MLETLITSKTRVRLLIKFFSNPATTAYLREIAEEFGESTNAVRIELNRLTKAKLLTSQPNGRTVEYAANTAHPLFGDINGIVTKTLGLDQVVLHLVGKLGRIERAFITGDYAKGIDSGIIDLVLVGAIDAALLDRLKTKLEQKIERKIRVLTLNREEYGRLRRSGQFEDALVMHESGGAATGTMPETITGAAATHS